MQLSSNKSVCERGFKAIRDLIIDYEKSVEDLELKLKYRETLVYEAEKALIHKKQFLQLLREEAVTMQHHLDGMIQPEPAYFHAQSVTAPPTQQEKVEEPAQKIEETPPNNEPNVYTADGKSELVAKTAKLRKEGLTIKQIATELGIPSGTISYLTWEFQIGQDGSVGGKRQEALAT